MTDRDLASLEIDVLDAQELNGADPGRTDWPGRGRVRSGDWAAAGADTVTTGR